jgi:Na+-transporting NADH:ubiquinone oxidoreductase subunit B
MKAVIRKLFDSQRSHFEGEGKLHALAPFFDAMETVFFATDAVTDTGPQVRDHLDAKRYLMLVIVSLLPALFFGIYNAGYQAHRMAGLSAGPVPAFISGLGIVLPLVIVSYGVGFGWEILFAAIRKHPISEGVFVTAMLFPLTLPPTTPLWQAALGISFGVVIGKEIFGGTGRNFLNPALTGRAFLFFAYPATMSGDAVWTAALRAKEAAVDAVSGATPLAVAAATGAGKSVEGALSSAGYDLSTLFFGRYPGSIGATSTLMCLLGVVFLMMIGIANYRIVLGSILGMLGTGVLVNLFATQSTGAFMTLNPFYHLVMGGAAFGIAFMATDPVSAPDMNGAKWIYGILIGFLTVLVRVFNPAFPEGMMLAILFMNLFAPLLDHGMVSLRLKKRVPNV